MHGHRVVCPHVILVMKNVIAFRVFCMVGVLVLGLRILFSLLV